jgi:hypothetical protein
LGGAVNVAHLVNFLCCVFFIVWGVGVYVAHLVSFLCCVFLFGGGGWISMLLILLGFWVVFFLGWETGVYVAHLVSFLCCVLGMSILLILLVFCAMFF